MTLERVIGHRDTGRTACPGAALYAQLPELRTLVETGSVAPFQSFATRLSAGLTDDSIDFGEPAPVSGALLDPSGLPLAGEQLELQVASDGSWRTARRVTTGPDGAFFTELKPSRRMYVRVRYPGRAPLRRATSTRLLLHLHPVILVTERPRRGVRGEPVAIAGSVGPRKPVLRLVVQQQRGTRWRKVYARNVRARRGLFETSFTPHAAGATATTSSRRRTSTPIAAPPSATRCASPTLLELLAVEAVAAGEHPRGAREDAQVEPQRAMLHVPDVELDPLGPGQ